MVKLLCWAISSPRSQVSDRRNGVPESFQTNSCVGLTLRPQHRGYTLRKLQAFGLTFF